MNVEDVIDVSVLDAIPRQKQVQCSLADQLQAAFVILNKFGLYDAADFVRREAHAVKKFGG